MNEVQVKRHKQLATRLFDVPLLITLSRLKAILAYAGPLVGVAADESAPAAYGPGDKGRERKPYFITEDGIAVIEIIGPLVKRNSGEFLSGGPTTYTDIEAEFTDAASDANVSGILLLVDSPGGEFSGALELSKLIYSRRGSKPVIAAVDGDAFSAGYALASAASEIFLAPSGGVGSVGVWMMHVDWSGANEKAGIKPTYMSAGARKLDGNPDAPLSPEAKQVFQDLVDGAYQMFVAGVARNRGMPEAAVRATEAGLFFGEPKDGLPTAVDVGFADQVGSVADAMAALRTRVAASRGQTYVATDAATAAALLDGKVVSAAAASAAISNQEEAEMAKTLAAAAAIPETANQQIAAGVRAEEIRRCAKCQKQAATGDKFCSACGAPIDDEEQEQPDEQDDAGASAAPATVQGLPLDSVRTESDIKAITALCAMAGVGAKTFAEYLTRKSAEGRYMSVAEVSDELTRLRVAESERTMITSTVDPNRGATANMQAIEAEAVAFARQNANQETPNLYVVGGSTKMTKERAAAQMLEGNPAAYAAFRAQHNAKGLVATLEAAGYKLAQ